MCIGFSLLPVGLLLFQSLTMLLHGEQFPIHGLEG
jgi:hypothetical protein